MNIFEWETEVYPQIHAEALAIGRQAKSDGLPRICNLVDSQFVHNGKLRLWQKIWEQGYDGWVDPSKEFPFRQMESIVNKMPTRPMEKDDLEDK